MNRAAICLVLAVAGCQSADAPQGPYTAASEGTRDTAKAEKLNREAADLLSGDTTRAEELLREALTADLFYGPAHNNLGVVYLGQQKLYEAASEFEWAKKLMPGHPDPRVNLGLVMEAAGRNDEAMASYEAALEVWPGYLPAIQGAASLVLRSGGKDDARLEAWLDEVALRGDDGWREWARTCRMGLLSRERTVPRSPARLRSQWYRGAGFSPHQWPVPRFPVSASVRGCRPRCTSLLPVLAPFDRRSPRSPQVIPVSA